MQDFADRILSLDRRFIFILIGLVILIPLLYPVGLPVRVSAEAQRVYDYIERLPEGARIVVSLDYDPASKPELQPMTVAILRHAFGRNLRLIGLTLWPTGNEHGRVGVDPDWSGAWQGVRPGLCVSGLCAGRGQRHPEHGSGSVCSFSDRLLWHADTHDSGPERDRSLQDVAYVFSLSAGFPGLDTWYVYGKEKYGFELGGGSVAVSVPKFYPLLNTGQIQACWAAYGARPSMKPCSTCRARRAPAWTPSRRPTFLIIGLIVVCNGLYFLSSRAGRGSGRRGS